MLIDFLVSSYMTFVILLFLAAVISVNKGIKIPAAGIAKAVIAMIFALEAMNYADNVFHGTTAYQPDLSIDMRIKLRTVVTALKYVLNPFIILLEIYTICPDRKYRIPIAIPTIINTAVYLPSVFGIPVAFIIDHRNEWVSYSRLSLTIYFALLANLIMLLLISVRHFRSKNRSSSVILLAIFAVSVMTAVLEYTNTLTGYVTPITALGVMAYYIYLSTIYQRSIRQEIAEKKLEASMSELTVLKNQMQPHFIYNALSTIRLLAKRDSEKAVESIDDFSSYLRSHIEAIKNDDLIPFTEELENVKVYLSMVQESYRSKIEVIYELGTSDFKLPPLSLEPIVENAVNHGISRLGGTITISTFEEESDIIIRVRDSGSKESSEEEYKPFHNGIGLENTAKRLKLSCGGELKTDFSGECGVVDIILPKHRNERESQ